MHAVVGRTYLIMIGAAMDQHANNVVVSGDGSTSRTDTC